MDNNRYIGLLDINFTFDRVSKENTLCYNQRHKFVQKRDKLNICVKEDLNGIFIRGHIDAF